MLTDARERAVSGPRNTEKISFLKSDLLCGLPNRKAKADFF